MLEAAHIPYILARHLQIDVDADPDPAYHLDADTDRDPAYYFDVYVDLNPTGTFQSDADPVQEPSFQIMAQNLEKVVKKTHTVFQTFWLVICK